MERIVDRSELLSQHSTPPSSPDIKTRKKLDEFEFVSHETHEDGRNAEDEEMDFLLFAPSTNKASGAAAEVAKIRVQTPPLALGEPGFVVPDRDQSYYFTRELSDKAKAMLSEAAVTGEDVQIRSHSSWPGSSYSWKVLHIQNTKGQRISMSNTNALFAKLCDDPTNHKRKRPGKKSRLKLRIKAAAAKARHDESRKAAELKEAEEREKRTRRNREKKVKKKQREKAKKTETAAVEERPRSQSPD